MLLMLLRKLLDKPLVINFPFYDWQKWLFAGEQSYSLSHAYSFKFELYPMQVAATILKFGSFFYICEWFK